MKRREAIKLTALATIGMAVSAEACLNSNSCNSDSKMNRTLMQPKDAKNLTKGEKKHTPLITLGDKDANGYTLVQITVGRAGIIHPSVNGHWIDFISLYVDKKLVGKTELIAEISRGAAAFRVKLDGASFITANAGCNLHGIWVSTIAI